MLSFVGDISSGGWQKNIIAAKWINAEARVALKKTKRKQVRPPSKPRQFARVFSLPRRPRADAVRFLLKQDAFHFAGEYKLNLWTKEANEEFLSCTDVRISKVDHTSALREISWIIMSTEKQNHYNWISNNYRFIFPLSFLFIHFLPIRTEVYPFKAINHKKFKGVSADQMPFKYFHSIYVLYVRLLRL